MKIVNRQAFRIVYKQPFQDWIDGLPDLPPEFDLKIEKLNRLPSVYLLPLQEDDEQLQNYWKHNRHHIFMGLLSEWVDDPDLWPSPFPEFEDWFDIEFFDMVKDFGDELLSSEDFSNSTDT